MLTDDVDALGTIGRHALTALVDRDTAALRAATDEGKAQLDVIAEATAALRTRLEAIPGIGPDDAIRIGPSLRARYDRLVSALSATDGLDASWTALTRGSLAAIELTTSLAAHDTETAAAGSLGRKGQYKKALAGLDRADRALATSRALRDKLAITTEVAILTRWIDLNAAYDAALRKTWTLLSKSKGKVTKAIRAAFAELTAAQAKLPPDSRAMIVIMADVARGGLNQAVISIEDARRELAAAAGPNEGDRPATLAATFPATSHWPIPVGRTHLRCTCVSRPISRGTSPPMSWPSRSSASPRSTVRWASSIGAAAVS